jgi:hypothetical protein
MIGKVSNHWKNGRRIFPIVGNSESIFSNRWKTGSSGYRNALLCIFGCAAG